MKFKYRLTQPYYYLVLLLVLIAYCAFLLLIFPFYFVGGLFWKPVAFWRIQDLMFTKLPKLPIDDED
jgi:hypothetical protein